jgi:ABC-type glycerol-3-phosphate transport system substrate-binding protein
MMITAACGAGGASSSAPASGSGGAAGGGSLTVLVEAGGKGELTPIADKCKAENGTTINFVELPYDGLFNRLNTEFASGSTTFDVAALDAIWLPTFADGLQPLDDMFTDDVKKDLFPATVAEAQVNGTFVGMPQWTNSEVLMYRKDLFEDPTQKANFKAKYGYDLVPPTTWQQFDDVAQFFTQDTNGDGTPDLYGTDVKGAVETEYLAHVLQAGSPGAVLDSTGKIIIDNQAHLDALNFYTNLNTNLKVSPPGASQIDWAAAQNLFNQGKTAMTRFWAHAYRQIPTDSPVYGKVGVAPMIGGTAGVAGIPGPWYLSIPKTTPNSDLAKQFIKCAYDNNALGITSQLGLASRISAFQQYQDKPGYENFKPLIDTLNAASSAPRPATPHWQQIVDTVLVPMLQKAVAGGADDAALLADAKAQIEQIQGS